MTAGVVGHEDAAGPGSSIFWRPALLVILTLGLILRVGWALIVPVEPISDAEAYHVFATNISQHGVYGWTPDKPGAYWAVGTSAIIAALYAVFGVDFGPVVVLNIVVSMAVIWQVAQLARHWFGDRAGLLAAGLIAFWPSLILYVTVLASEVFFLFFVLGGALAFLRPWRQVWLGILVSGLFWAVAVYVRPIALFLPLVFGFALIVRGARFKSTFIKVVVTMLVMAIAIAPWTARNYQVFGKPVLISTNFGPNFWMGNNPETRGFYMPLPDRARGLSETDRAAMLQSEAMDYIRAEPLAFLTRTAIKFLRLHERETVAVHMNMPGIERSFGSGTVLWLKVLTTGYWSLILALSLVGLVLLARRIGLFGMLLHPATLYWLYVSAIHAIIVIGDRYHFPAIPIIAVLAALSLSALVSRLWQET